MPLGIYYIIDLTGVFVCPERMGDNSITVTPSASSRHFRSPSRSGFAFPPRESFKVFARTGEHRREAMREHAQPRRMKPARKRRLLPRPYRYGSAHPGNTQNFGVLPRPVKVRHPEGADKAVPAGWIRRTVDARFATNKGERTWDGSTARSRR